MSRSVVVGDHVYEGVDAARTIASIPALWAHHTHGTATSRDDLGDELIATLARHAGVTSPPNGTIEDRLVDLANAIGDRLETLDDVRLASVLDALWSCLAKFRDTSVEHEGRVERLFAGAGLPKPEVSSFAIGWAGPSGDVRRSRVHHGRPHQAVCLWSSEMIATLAAEGHPIAPGCAGENVTISGLPWSAMRPGALLLVGSAHLRLTAYTTPCSSNANWFSGGNFDRMSHLRGDVSRLYAMVLTPGIVAIGDRVVVRSDN